MKSFLVKTKNKIINMERAAYLSLKRRKLKNYSPTIISNNCTGGVIYHDLGLKFTSPTINLFFEAEGFLRFVENLEHYLSLEVTEVPSALPYPVGRIGDVKIYFMHYNSFEEAKAKWEERAKRATLSNLYIIMTEREGCTPSIMKRYDSLQNSNKVLLTHIPMPDIQCACYLPGFENETQMGVVTDLKKGLWQRRYLDDFDYVRFLNVGFHD